LQGWILPVLQTGFHERGIKIIFMATLHNRISRKELKLLALQEQIPRNTLSFYAYFPIENPKVFRDEWYLQLNKWKVYGRIYVAEEGINAQINCPVEHFDLLKTFIYGHSHLNGLRLNKAVEEKEN
jgi:UPF0176 protein